MPRNATNGNPFKQPKAPVKSYHDDSDVVSNTHTHTHSVGKAKHMTS